MSEQNDDAAEHGDSGPKTEPAPPPSPGDEKDAELARLHAERDRIKDQLLRTAADFDNFRKRSRKDVEDAVKRGKEDAIRELLPVGDNLSRALTAASGNADPKALVDGVKMVLKLLEDGLERLGAQRVPSVGERFDPAVHEAIQQVETSEHPPGTVVAEHVAGYRLGDRLLRAAMVAVAKPPSAPASE